MTVIRICPDTGKENKLELPITDQQWSAYNTGNSTVDHCFPQLSEEEKEFIKTGRLNVVQN